MENKPLIIAIEEAEQTLYNAVNQILSSGVPAYFVKGVFDKVYAELKNMADNEVKVAKQNWEAKLAEQSSETSKNEVEETTV